jgi:hypothetical protein
MDLIQQLTSNLGVQEDQAKGGVGLLLKLAQDKLGAGEFSQVADAIPGANDMMSSAPDSGGGIAGTIGGIASALGGSKAEGLGDLASLAAGFSQLNLDTSQIGQFVPVLLSFVQGQGGDGVKGILEKVLNPGK